MKNLFDSHAHLDDEAFDYDREKVIENLKENNIGWVLNPGADMPSSRRAVKLASEYENIYAAIGVHPHDAENFKEEDILELKELAKNKKVVAIGEIGLDYYYDNSPRDIQRKVFKRQMDLAYELNLPVAIHSRDATGETFEILSEYKGKVKGIIHCYTGAIEMAKRYIDLGYYISIAGPVTFKNARVVKEMAEEVPISRLLIETDSPYMAPTPFRGKRNEPKYVRYVAEEIAKLKDMDVDELIAITRQNTVDILNIEGKEIYD